MFFGWLSLGTGKVFVAFCRHTECELELFSLRWDKMGISSPTVSLKLLSRILWEKCCVLKLADSFIDVSFYLGGLSGLMMLSVWVSAEGGRLQGHFCTAVIGLECCCGSKWPLQHFAFMAFSSNTIPLLDRKRKAQEHSCSYDVFQSDYWWKFCRHGDVFLVTTHICGCGVAC